MWGEWMCLVQDVALASSSLWCDGLIWWLCNESCKISYHISFVFRIRSHVNCLITIFWNLAIWIFFFNIWWIWVIFSMKNPLYKWKPYFLGQILMKCCVKKRICTHFQYEVMVNSSPNPTWFNLWALGSEPFYFFYT
jgi:hypothetical protein